MIVAFTALLAVAAPDFQAIDRFAETEKEAHGSPGLALVIVKDGELVHRRGFGEGVTTESPFVLGSLSKSITAVRVMQLVEQGAVDLDATVVTYLPDFRVADAEASAAITVRQLMDQSSGLSRRAPVATGDDLSLEAHVLALATAELTQVPGAGHRYASPNYIVAGRIVEVIGGASFATQIADHVFAPLAMKHSHVSIESAMADNLVPGHRLWFGWPLRHDHRAEPDRLPTAALIASADDLGRYLIMHMAGGLDVLTSTSVATLHHPSAKAKRFDYAMGWRVGPTAGVDSLWHGGTLPSYRGACVMVPSTGWGVVVLSNVSSPIYDHTRHIASGVVAMLHGGTPPASERPLVTVHQTAGLFGAIVAILELWALLTARRWAKRKKRSLVIVAIGKIGWPLLVLAGIPLWTKLSYGDLYASLPDLTSGLLLVMALSLASGVARTMAVARAASSG